jgi:hypothetical protein
VRYCFKKDPNVPLLVEQEADAVARDETRVDDKIKEMLERRLAGHRTAIVWPQKPADVPDGDPSFLVAYMPLDFAGMPRDEREARAKEFLGKYGEKPRQYRNGLGLAVPAKDQIEILRRAVRYLLAIEGVKDKARQHNLTDAQKAQLRERNSTETAAAESGFLKLYTEVWLPRMEAEGLGIEKVAVGGRPLQITLNEKKEAKVHERVMELLTVVQPRVFDSVTPTKIAELFKLGQGELPKLGIRTAEIVDGFYSFLGFTRLTSGIVIQKAVARGVREGNFGYVSGVTPEVGEDGKFQVSPDRVRVAAAVAEDEIDLETGFLMTPQAIPQPETVPVGGTGETPAGVAETPGATGTVAVTPGSTEGTTPVAEAQKSFEATFSGNRDQLYNAWNAIANLADMAGKVTVSIKADSERGFDRSKLQNGVVEPLREADLIE